MAKPNNAWQMVVLRVNFDPAQHDEPRTWDWTGLTDSEVVMIGAGDICLPGEAHGNRDLLVGQGDLDPMTDEEYDAYRERRNYTLERYDENVARYLEAAERDGVQKAGTFPGFPYVYTTPSGVTVFLNETPVADSHE